MLTEEAAEERTSEVADRGSSETISETYTFSPAAPALPRSFSSV